MYRKLKNTGTQSSIKVTKIPFIVYLKLHEIQIVSVIKLENAKDI